MQFERLISQLTQQFAIPIEAVGPRIWRATMEWGDLVVILSEEESWVRLMIPVASIAQVQPFFQELLEMNFEATTSVKYALAQQMLWVVFNHPLQTLQDADLEIAINCLVSLKVQGLSKCLDTHADQQVRLIVMASKRQGLTLQATLQNLERFYREGIIGDLSDTGETIQLTLDRWRQRLERLWSEDNVNLF